MHTDSGVKEGRESDEEIQHNTVSTKSDQVLSQHQPSKMQPNAKPGKTFIFGCLVANIAMAIGIVMVNKMVYKLGFPNITLTFLHFVFTSVGMCICLRAGMFEFKRVEIIKMVPIALTFCGFVVFTNLSLKYNTVGTYQVIKALTTPCIIVLQTTFYSRHFSLPVKLTLVPIALGVYLNSYYDIEFNVLGVTIALIGVLVTSLYQVWVAEKQKELGLNAQQLLFYQAPLSAFFLLFVIPFAEPVFSEGGIFSASWGAYTLFLMTVTGLIAFGINLSIYWIIGNTSPLTYNMVGQLKICLVILGGFLLFHDPVNILQGLGICLSIGGVSSYTFIRMKEQDVEKARAAAAAAAEASKSTSTAVELEKSPK